MRFKRNLVSSGRENKSAIGYLEVPITETARGHGPPGRWREGGVGTTVNKAHLPPLPQAPLLHIYTKSQFVPPLPWRRIGSILLSECNITRKEFGHKEKPWVISWRLSMHSCAGCTLHNSKSWPFCKTIMAAPKPGIVQRELCHLGEFMQLLWIPLPQMQKGMKISTSWNSLKLHLAQSWLFNRCYWYDSIERV